MLANVLRDYMRAVPFEPFAIQLNDGRRFEVPHQDFAALSPRDTEFYVFPSARAKSGIHVSTLLIASIEPLRTAER